MRLALWEARRAAASQNYDVAARFYLALFNELTVEDRQKFASEFVAVLEEMGSASGSNDYSNQIMLLLECRVLFPREAAILNACTKFFFIAGRLLEAFDFAQEAVSESTDTERIHAYVNLENIKSNIMDQWHWAMLNDIKRNTAYATAIQRVAVWKPRANVLDIGAGTGLLTSIADRYFENNIYCCEADPNMCDIAEKILKKPVIRKHSSEVTLDDIGHNEIDVVITETMDCGLLGEGIVCSIYDVQKRILSFSHVVIPKCATVYACIVESPAIMNEHVVVFCGHRFVSESVTASYEPFGGSQELEPYSCCSAQEIHGGYKILSNIVELFAINFNDHGELHKIVNDGFTELRMAPIIQDGTAHCIMAWFSCEVFPGAPILDTGPETSGCWQQAIYPLPKPINLHRGDICTLQVRAYKDQLLCAVREIVCPENFGNGGPCCSCSTSTNATNSFSNQSIAELNCDDSTDEASILPAKLIKRDQNDAADMIISYRNYAELDTLTILPNNDFLLMNDRQLVDFFKCSLANIQQYKADMYILDITNLASLSMALVVANPEKRFSCYNSDAQRLIYLFYPHVFSFGIFSDDQENLMTDGDRGPGCSLITKPPKIPRSYFQDADCTDVLLCWPISSHGFLLEPTLDRLLSFRLCNKQAQIIPSKVSIVGQVVSCPDIVQRSKPCPSAYQGVDLSAINDLAISFYYDIELSALKHEVFSHPFELLTFRLDTPMPSDPTEMPEFMSLIEVPSETTITANGTADGLLFWFDVESGEQLYSTHSYSNLTRCAIYLFDENRKVSKGDKLAFKTSNFHGNIVFELF